MTPETLYQVGDTATVRQDCPLTPYRGQTGTVTASWGGYVDLSFGDDLTLIACSFDPTELVPCPTRLEVI